MHHPILDNLLPHDRWATDQMLSALEPLNDQQLDRAFEIGPGSLRAGIFHVINTPNGWLASILKTEPIAIDAKDSIPTMQKVHSQVAERFERFARTEPIDESITATRCPRTITASRSSLVSHLLTHSFHHRTQMLNMLRHTGVKPLPKASVLEWMLATDRAKLVVTPS